MKSAPAIFMPVVGPQAMRAEAVRKWALRPWGKSRTDAQEVLARSVNATIAGAEDAEMPMLPLFACQKESP